MGLAETKIIDCDPARNRLILKLDVFQDSEIEIQLGKTWSVLRFKEEDKSNDLHLSFNVYEGYARDTHLTCRAIEYYKSKHQISFVKNWNEIEEWYYNCCDKLQVDRDNNFMNKVKSWHYQVKENITVRIEHDEL